MSLIARSRERAKKREEKEKSKHKYRTLVYKRGGKDVVYRKVGGNYFRVKDDGVLAKAPAADAILSALNTGPSHQFISLPSNTQSRVTLAKNTLGILKGLGKKKVSNIKKGQAQASTLNDASITTNKKDKKVVLPVLKKKQDKKNGKTTTPLQTTKTKNVKTTKTKALQNKPKNGNGNGAKTKTKKPESRLDAKGNYKGTNIKPTKLQLERLKKRGLA